MPGSENEYEVPLTLEQVCKSFEDVKKRPERSPYLLAAGIPNGPNGFGDWVDFVLGPDQPGPGETIWASACRIALKEETREKREAHLLKAAKWLETRENADGFAQFQLWMMRAHLTLADAFSSEAVSEWPEAGAMRPRVRDTLLSLVAAGKMPLCWESSYAAHPSERNIVAQLSDIAISLLRGSTPEPRRVRLWALLILKGPGGEEDGIPAELILEALDGGDYGLFPALRLSFIDRETCDPNSQVFRLESEEAAQDYLIARDLWPSGWDVRWDLQLQGLFPPLQGNSLGGAFAIGIRQLFATIR